MISAKWHTSANTTEHTATGSTDVTTWWRLSALKDAVWFLLITAIGIPIGGVIESVISSRFDRATSRQSALLAASQQRRDAEIAQMRDALTDLLDASTAVQSFAWFVDADARLNTRVRW
jgi:hypothetical protein